MPVDFFEISYRLQKISGSLHELSREIEFATFNTTPSIDKGSLRDIADSIHREAKRFRIMGVEFSPCTARTCDTITATSDDALQLILK